MNGIIHPCCNPQDREPPKSEEEMIKAIYDYLDHVFSLVRPRKLVYFAIDGVAPRAKMNQQRARRFRTAREGFERKREIEHKVAQLQTKGIEPEYYHRVTKPKHSFDSNCITPGTRFMAMISVKLKQYIDHRMATSRAWQSIQVVLSDASVPGEGEHKIMAFIREQRSHTSCNSNLRHVLYGADADLILLGLATHEKYFYVIREEFVPLSKQPCPICGYRGHNVSACKGVAPKASQSQEFLMPYDDRYQQQNKAEQKPVLGQKDKHLPEQSNTAGNQQVENSHQDMSNKQSADTPQNDIGTAQLVEAKDFSVSYSTETGANGSLVAASGASCLQNEVSINDDACSHGDVIDGNQEERKDCDVSVSSTHRSPTKNAQSRTDEEDSNYGFCPLKRCYPAFLFVDLPRLQMQLQEEFIPKDDHKKKQDAYRRTLRMIDDWILLCSLVGNDFLPHLPSLSIHEGALDMLMGLYKRLQPTLGGYLHTHGHVHLSRLGKVLVELGVIEDDIIRQRYMESKQRTVFKEQAKLLSKFQLKELSGNQMFGLTQTSFV